MDWYTVAVAIYLACGVIYFAHRDQRRHDAANARYAAALSAGMPVDRNVEYFATALTEQRLGRGPTCL